MQNAQTWLSQGDLFRAIPIVETTVTDGVVEVRLDNGPSLLCSHGCELDKRTRSGASTLKRIQFVPLRAVAVLNEDRRSELRAWHGDLNPARIFHVGLVEGLGDVFCNLTEIYSLPAEYFLPELREFTIGDAIEHMLVATENDNRLGQVDEDQLDLLRRKLMTFMTRFKIEP